VGIGNMGERGKDDVMKHRKTNVEAVEPVAEKPESQEPMLRPATTPPKSEARLGREVQARIGQQLRSMYNDVVNQGVPDHIADLVRRLGDQDQD
jgi:Anti-sigma factor NepR